MGIPNKDSFNLVTRKKLIASQLSIFIGKYEKETNRQKEGLENVENNNNQQHLEFDFFAKNATESELEEILTLYTKRNKSAAIFLGTKPKPKVLNNNNSEESPENLDVIKSSQPNSPETKSRK